MELEGVADATGSYRTREPVMTTGSVGTSRGSTGVPGGTGLPPPFATLAILLTTSMPDTTLPNTV